jgi:heme-degrading monooxygenase HmoA
MTRTNDRSNCFILEAFDRTLWCAIAQAPLQVTDIEGHRSWASRPNEPDAGCSITVWENEADMRAFWDSKKREDAMALLRPFFLNQFTVTHCEVRLSQHE